MKKIIVLLFILVAIDPAFSSNMDHLFFHIGESEIDIRWSYQVDEFYELENVYSIIALVASNYEIIRNAEQNIFIQCFKKDNKYSATFFLGEKEPVSVSYNSFQRLVKVFEDFLAEVFGFKSKVAESFPLLMLSIPVDDTDFPNYDGYLEFYYGAAPGTMQSVEDKVVYYNYFFFNETELIDIIKNEIEFNGYLVKKQMTRDNIGQITTGFK